MKIYNVGMGIVAPIGLDKNQAFENIKNNSSSITPLAISDLAAFPIAVSQFNEEQLNAIHLSIPSNTLTLLEKIAILSVQEALQDYNVLEDGMNTILILASTKGNIQYVNTEYEYKCSLHYSAKKISDYFHLQQDPLVVSNACISGVEALIVGQRLIEGNQCNHVIIVGVDVLSAFTIAGFKSFQAMDSEVCKPFDAERVGVNLGEGAACIILSDQLAIDQSSSCILSGGAVSNDANHLSGPSKTGKELGNAITNALSQAKVAAGDITVVSAHGTATIYNDEMEAKALSLAGLEGVYVNSLKSYFGHTFGCAGVIESVLNIMAMKEQLILPTYNFTIKGVDQNLRFNSDLKSYTYQSFLKTAAGFGGCNAALVWAIQE